MNSNIAYKFSAPLPATDFHNGSRMQQKENLLTVEERMN